MSVANRTWLRALEMTGKLGADRDALPLIIDRLGDVWGEAPALLSANETLSYRDLAARARAYSRWALSVGVTPGQVVAVMMPNRPDYLAIWLGVTRIGGVAALLNTNLAGVSLAHCIALAGPRHIVVAAELAERLDSALPLSTRRPCVWVRGGEGGLSPLDYPDGPMDGSDTPVALHDRALLIYTSGTTGLPKAAHVSHHRLLMWSGWFSGMMAATSADRLYNCLPMYHSVGGVVATGAMLLSGGSMVVREKFSAGTFWSDVAHYDCTIFQYIGELCRYLLAAPPHPLETAHRLRLACGNGLRERVWTGFQARFEIPRILEFYAATEGTFSLYNAEGKPGAVGRIPGFLKHRFPAAVVRYAPAAGLPLRGADGLCIRCGPDEPGEAIGRIAGASDDPANRFEGYTSAAETEKKVLRNVFEAGDAWMRTGDLMRVDAQGYFYFVDRLGETFRWKGENVSAAEVADAVAACPGVADVAVYGVEVPGAEGRAGMAALVAGEGFDLAALRATLAKRLPAYARPLFLRLVGALDATGTFKLQKQKLVEEGFDLAQVSDPLYVDESVVGVYRPLDAETYRSIKTCEVRL